MYIYTDTLNVEQIGCQWSKIQCLLNSDGIPILAFKDMILTKQNPFSNLFKFQNVKMLSLE